MSQQFTDISQLKIELNAENMSVGDIASILDYGKPRSRAIFEDVLNILAKNTLNDNGTPMDQETAYELLANVASLQFDTLMKTAMEVLRQKTIPLASKTK